MLWGSPLLDFIWIISLAFFVKHYLFLRDLNDEEKRLVLYSYTWVRIVIVLSIVGEIGYVIGSDIALFDGKYYIHCLDICVLTFYLCALWDIYIGYKHGPKTSEYKESLRIRIQAVIALPLIVLLMYFFMD